MPVVKENKIRLLCTICGKEIILETMRDNGMYIFPYKGKNYKVYEYECPYCSTKTHISEKFLNDLNKD